MVVDGMGQRRPTPREYATPDFGVVLDEDHSLIGIADYGGKGSSAGIANSGGTLYQL
jgi:hypothetical protein